MNLSTGALWFFGSKTIRAPMVIIFTRLPQCGIRVKNEQRVNNSFHSVNR